MKYGHKLNVTVEDYDERGRGTCIIGIDNAGKQTEAGQGAQNTVLAIPFTCRGDQAQVTFLRREYGVKVCGLDKLNAPGPDRVPAPCAHAGTCGGCLWQHVDYQAQISEKEKGVRGLFASFGLEDKVKPIVPAENKLGYRNRMDYCVGWNREVGLKEYGSWNKYVDVKECLLMKNPVGPILQTVRDWMATFDLLPWDAKFHTGDVRYAVIRDGQNTNQRMITIVIKDSKRVSEPARKWLAEKLQPMATTLLLGELTKDTDLSLAETFEPLFGQPWLEEQANGLTYRIHPNSFFQTNSAMAAQLQSAVLDSLRSLSPTSSDEKSIPMTKDEGRRTILDLYCGLGFMGIAAAKTFPDAYIYGYELDEQAIKLASENAKLNGVGERCEFQSGKAEDLSWKDIPANAVIVDPPRSGLHPKVIMNLVGEGSMLPDSILYVSCNYHRLKDELPAFLEHYQVESVLPLDLFPQTRHVEVVISLKRKAA